MAVKHQTHAPVFLRGPAAFIAATLLQLFAPSVLFIAVFATLVALAQGAGYLLGLTVGSTAVYLALGLTLLLAAWQGKNLLVGINQALRIRHGIGHDTYLRSFALYCQKLQPTEPPAPAAKTDQETRRNANLA